MKLIFDQNISHKILKLLTSDFKDSTTVKKENLIDLPDRRIWEYAKNNDYTIVTHDYDFNYFNSLYGFPPKIIWIRTGNLKTESIAKILNEHSSKINDFWLDPAYGCFEILALKK